MQIHRDESAVKPSKSWQEVAGSAIFAVWSLGVYALTIWLIK